MITLEYPVSAPTYSYTLPSPDLGDVERIALGNVFGRTRNGAVLNKYDAGQPALTTLTWTISKMTQAQKTNLILFINASAGDSIKVTDYNSDTFNALLTNPVTAIKTLRDDCRYEVTLDFLVVS